MRTLAACLFAGLCLASTPSGSVAQTAARWTALQAPVTVSIRVPAQRPSLSTRGLLGQIGTGVLGGIVGGGLVGIPLMLSAWESPVSEALVVGLIGGAYLGGTAAGIHYAGRGQGMKGNPWATTGGIVSGLVVSGAMMQPFIDHEGNAAGPAPLLVFVVPSMGGTAGYALTRRSR